MTSGTARASRRSVADWVQWAEQRMLGARLWFGHGTDNARDEAVWLVSHVLGIDPAAAGEHAQMIPDSSQAGAIEHLIGRRIDERLPAAYLTGSAWFAGLQFEVSDNVLIPRSPIAELIAGGLGLWPLAPADRVLDLCTGSGCIAIALAKYFPTVQVDASDLSAPALAVAARNIARHQCADRVQLLCGDLFEPLADTRYRLIVSNPPYVARDQMEQLPLEYQHEPGLALESGTDGLDLPLAILARAGHHLTADGSLILEVGEAAQSLMDLFPQLPWTWLEFEYGGDGVLTLNQQELTRYQPMFQDMDRQRKEAVDGI